MQPHEPCMGCQHGWYSHQGGALPGDDQNAPYNRGGILASQCGGFYSVRFVSVLKQMVLKLHSSQTHPGRTSQLVSVDTPSTFTPICRSSKNLFGQGFSLQEHTPLSPLCLPLLNLLCPPLLNPLCLLFHPMLLPQQLQSTFSHLRSRHLCPPPRHQRRARRGRKAESTDRHSWLTLPEEDLGSETLPSQPHPSSSWTL